MAGSSFGKMFRISTYGESHGLGIGVVIDGCPAGIEIDNDFLQNEMARRKPGQSKIVTQRQEDDEAIIQSGVFEGKTTGTPIHIFIPNEDQRSKDYSHISNKYRPSHADYVYDQKYGFRDYRGGGRSSARETAARVAAGAIAKLLLSRFGIKISAFVSQVGNIIYDFDTKDIKHRPEINEVRCPDETIGNQMIDLIKEIKKQGDTIGGKVTCFITGTPVGLGEPVFDKLHADLGKAMLNINACKGFEYGSGFRSITMKGSEHNDVFTSENGKITTKTNYSGGIQGGISNGMPIYFNVAFKPVATIIPEQESVNNLGESTTIVGKGRHDPCVVPRAVPIVEAMAAIVLADHLLRQKAYEAINIIEK
jgi:chorismate synthase